MEASGPTGTGLKKESAAADDEERPMKTRLGRLASALAAVTGLALALAAGYEWREVRRARSETPAIVSRALATRAIRLRPEQLSAWQLEALLAVQDPGFFSHPGWDFAHGTMTTITQALVKWYYFDDYEPGLAKIRQSLIARFALDPLVSKRDQLSLFLNNVWLANVDGRDVLGLAEGAERLYGKSFGELTREEFLSLLVFDQPARLNVHADPAANARRVQQIERLLAGRCRRPDLLRLRASCYTEDPQ